MSEQIMPKKLLIDGRWVDALSKQTIDSINPATEAAIATIPAGDKADIDAAVAAARASFEAGSWRNLSGAARANILWKVAELLEQHGEHLAAIEIADNGTPLAFVKGGVEKAADAFRYYAGWCTKIEGKSVDLDLHGMKMHGYTLPEPKGVAGLITPWNFPLIMAAEKLAPALAAGCSCVVKPPELASLTTLYLGQLLIDAGIPAGVVNIVTGFGETAGQALADHDDVDVVSFTGSTAVGKKLVRSSAGNLKTLHMELGGKSPFIICKDADLARAIPFAAMANFSLSGQMCIAGSRVFVQRDIYEQVCAGLAQAANAMSIGDPAAATTQIGPLISQRQLDRALGYAKGGSEEGGAILAGGGRVDRKGFFMQPTVIAGATDAMRIMREEIFGPLASVTPFDEPDEAIVRANRTRYGLSASIWTQNIASASRATRALRAGTVWVNAHMFIDHSMPFGGYKESGWGRENGYDGVAEYLQTKSVLSVL